MLIQITIKSKKAFQDFKKTRKVFISVNECL